MLPLRFVLECPDQPIEYAYFPESGLGSVVAVGGAGNRIEAGLFGREGMSALAVVMGSDRSPHETVVQYAGAGVRISTGSLLSAMADSGTMRSTFQKYAFAFSVQTAHTALSNGRQTLYGRLARWILMCQDRLGTDDVAITHEYISIMLGVRRPGVTLAMQELESEGLVSCTRSNIRVLDRAGLLILAGGFYGTPESEFERLMGS